MKELAEKTEKALFAAAVAELEARNARSEAAHRHALGRIAGAMSIIIVHYGESEAQRLKDRVYSRIPVERPWLF